jgi:hypothetical protein
LVRPQPAAAHMVVGRAQMYRPVLKLVRMHSDDFPLQSLSNLLIRKRPAKKSRHFHVAPKLPRQWKVIHRPTSKRQPFRSQKIGIGSFGNHFDRNCHAELPGAASFGFKGAGFVFQPDANKVTLYASNVTAKSPHARELLYIRLIR